MRRAGLSASTELLLVCADAVKPAKFVRDLHVREDSQTASNCFTALRQIRRLSTRHCVSQPVCRHGAVAFVWRYINSIIMRPSSLGGGRILRRTLSVRLSVRPSRYRYRASRRAT